MKTDLKTKLTSRKLWMAVVGVVIGIAAAFGVTENDVAQIFGILGSIGSVVAYICGETAADTARAAANGKIEAARANAEQRVTHVFEDNDGN